MVNCSTGCKKHPVVDTRKRASTYTHTHTQPNLDQREREKREIKKNTDDANSFQAKVTA